MKEFLLSMGVLAIIISIIFTGIKNAIVSSDWYQAGKEIVMSFKEYSNTPKIENYSELVNSDVETSNGVKRVNLDWSLFRAPGGKVIEGIPMPTGYHIDASSDKYIQISPDYKSNIILSENDMIEFITNTFLPSDVEFVSHKAYFKERHRSNGTDSDIGEYIYKSDASNSSYKITFTYNYVYKNRKTTLNNYYSYVTIDKEIMD